MSDSKQDRDKREQEIYQREQEMTALYRQTLKAIREDAEEAVAAAVRSAAPAPADWEGIVRRVVREEMASTTPPRIDGPVPASAGAAGSRPWPTWAAAVVGALTAVVLVGAGWWAGRLWGPWPAQEAAGGDGVPSVVVDRDALLMDTLRAVPPDSLGVPADSSQVRETGSPSDSALDIGPDSSGLEIRPEDVP